MINEINIEKALDFIRDNSDNLAKAKAERVYLEQFRKSKKAILVSQVKGTIQERESYAYSHPDYIELLEGLKASIEIEESLKWKMIAAQAKVEVWRSQQANNRAIDRAHH
jgi:hypothetical protein